MKRQKGAGREWQSGVREPMQAVDRIERRGDSAFLPGRQVGSVFSREHDAAVKSAQNVVVLDARRLCPKTEATHRKRRPMPSDCDPVVELLAVLRMDVAAVFNEIGKHTSELQSL